jgi:hypothetical protein
MSADTDRLFNNARTLLPGAIDTTLSLELFNVLNDFYQNSNLWQENITFAVTPAGNTYTVAPSGTSPIVRLLYILNSAGRPVYGTMATPGTIVLNTAPPQNDTYTATVALTVDDPVGGDGFPVFPAWTLNKYGTGILDGLVARMMAQPAKPYSNMTLATFHMRKFRSAISQARGESVRQNLNNAQAWRFPQSFASRRR